MTSNTELTFKNEFREWLREYKAYEESTIDTRIANVERIQNTFGSLIDHYNKDFFEDIFDSLAYTKADEHRNKRYDGRLEIFGNIYNCLATYRSALKLYAAFLTSSKSNIIAYPFGEIGKKVKDALTSLSKNSTKRISYNASQVKDLIINPLVKILQQELSPLGYNFETEHVAMINDNKKHSKDRYDIFGKADDKPIIIIEIDTHRADQVAKKFVSRLSLNQDTEMLYVALVYPNNHESKDSEKKECKKYFKFINTLFANELNPRKHFISHWL